MNRSDINTDMNDSAIETIYHEKMPVALIIPSGVSVDGISYITDPLNSLQIGLHHRPAGMKLAAHTHIVPAPVSISEYQEVLYIISGSIELTLYTTGGDIIAKRTLNAGDSALLIREGHQVTYLEETRMFEVKQGPYPGASNAKLYLRETQLT